MNNFQNIALQTEIKENSLPSNLAPRKLSMDIYRMKSRKEVFCSSLPKNGLSYFNFWIKFSTIA